MFVYNNSLCINTFAFLCSFQVTKAAELMKPTYLIPPPKVFPSLLALKKKRLEFEHRFHRLFRYF
ncbi:hypothetical protein V6Z12_A11G144700 [Gossypium hirsutum]